MLPSYFQISGIIRTISLECDSGSVAWWCAPTNDYTTKFNILKKK